MGEARLAPTDARRMMIGLGKEYDSETASCFEGDNLDFLRYFICSEIMREARP